ALIWSFGVHLKRNLLALGIESLISSATNKARHRGQPLPPAESLDVLIKNLIRRGYIRSRTFPDFNIVGVLRRRSTVLLGQARSHSRANVPTMAGITSHLAASAEVSLVEVVYHSDHSARYLLSRIVQGIRRRAARVVAFGAVHAERRSNETHRAHE